MFWVKSFCLKTILFCGNEGELTNFGELSVLLLLELICHSDEEEILKGEEVFVHPS